jgi:hypothetical protein
MKTLHKLITTLLLIVSFSSYAGEMLEGRVVGVHDGDTATLLISGNDFANIEKLKRQKIPNHREKFEFLHIREL